MEAELHRSAADINYSLRLGSDAAVCKLRGTIKTHKDPIAVTMRPIHAASRYAWSGLGAWLSSRFMPILRRYVHICHSPSESVSRIFHIRVATDEVLLHWDVDDFYMTGTADHLISHSRLLCPLSERKLVAESLAFLLERQFLVTNPGGDTDLIFKMVLGAGQGLNYSAGLASTAFLHAIELTGPAIIKEGFLSRHSISHYTRYADNLFFVVKRVAVSGLLEALKNIRPYTGKVESVGEGCPILDLNLYRGPRFKCSSCLDFEPIMRIKGPPLSPDSNHPSSLHVAWPSAYIHRLWLRSSSLRVFHTARDQFLNRLACAGWPNLLLQHLARIHYHRACAPSDLDHKRYARTSLVEEVWQSFPYHPLLKPLLHEFRAFANSPQAIRELQYCLKSRSPLFVRACWKLVASRHRDVFTI